MVGGHEAAADGTGLGTAILTGYLAGAAAAAGGPGAPREATLPPPGAV